MKGDAEGEGGAREETDAEAEAEAEENLWSSTRRTVEEEGAGVLYNGYKENILYAFPADALKFGIYEKLLGGRSKKGIPPLEGAVLGAISTGLAQAMTTPFDVVRNRVMVESSVGDAGDGGGSGGSGGGGGGGGEGEGGSKSESKRGYLETIGDIAREEGVGTLFAGTTPRIGKAVLSGFVQFGTYEVSFVAKSNTTPHHTTPHHTTPHHTTPHHTTPPPSLFTQPLHRLFLPPPAHPCSHHPRSVYKRQRGDFLREQQEVNRVPGLGGQQR